MAHTPMFRKFILTLQQARRENLKAECKPLPLRKNQFRSTRRRFIKLATLAGGSALATSTLSQAERAWSARRRPSIAIVGGGIAGLNAAYQLKKVGFRATVYEARTRLGGRIRSVTGKVGPGLVSDIGGHFINTDHTDMRQLAKEFGLKLFNREKDAKRFPYPEVGYFFDGSLRSEAEVAQKLRPLARQISKDADLVDRDFDQFAPRFDRISVTQYLNTHADKIPEPFIRDLIENSIRTECGVEPSEASSLQLLSFLPTVEGREVEVLSYSDEVFVVEGGSGRIIDGLASALSSQIQTRKRLTRIQSQERSFRLTFADNQVVNADFIIMAIPFTVLRTVDLQVDLPQQLGRFIQEVDLGSNEKLYAGFTKKIWRQENGFILEIWTDRGFSEAWDGTQRQANRKDGALTFFLGGDEVTALQSSSPKSLGREFVKRFEEIIPGAKDAATGRFLGTQWAKDPLARGAYTNFKPGQLTKFGSFLYIESGDPAERQDVNVGNLVFAGEHLSDEFYGFMNGAAQTGRLAAEVVIQRYKGN